MSTRCIIHFHDEATEPEASVYRHHDGYPEHECGMAASLGEFFAEVMEQTGAVGYDANLLAAQYLIWQAERFREEGDGPLKFRSVYLMNIEPSDIQYRYRVYCGYDPLTPMQEQREFPRVTVEERSLYSGIWSDPKSLQVSAPLQEVGG